MKIKMDTLYLNWYNEQCRKGSAVNGKNSEGCLPEEELVVTR